ncbi:MAG: hypothetical protein K8R74_10170 [Bacteroidales bacterium]|nr:hypothetical protein [Bacteroidales bacterium]
MIFKEENTLKAEQVVITNLNTDTDNSQVTNNYKELLGLSYNNNYTSLIPNRFKWGRNLIKVVD